MKYFVFSDVHSFYDELMTALNEKGFDINNPEHIIISCGDLFDRGDKSKECLEFVVSLIKQGRALCVKGNHESMMEDVFMRHYFKQHDFHNGTNKTFDQLCSNDSPDLSPRGIIADVMENEDLKTYLTSCADFHEIDDNIFVHGWIPFSEKYGKDMWLPPEKIYNKKWRSASFDSWEQARWVNGMQLWANGIREPNKTIYCGHFHASWGHANLHNEGVEHLKRIETMTILDDGTVWPYVKYDTFKDEGICCLDACTILSHKVNVEVIEL